jgi:hypothetical protein
MRQFKTKPTGRPPINEAGMPAWIHARVTKEQAEKVREMGGSKFLRDLIDQKLSESRPVRLEDVWGKT